MAESLFSTFAISGQGMSVQRKRLSAVANNIANANTTRTEDGGPYRREVVIVRGEKQQPFLRELSEQIGLRGGEESHLPSFGDQGLRRPVSALKSISSRDSSEPRQVYDPAHPDANEEGYVAMPNINIVTEMVEMISAQRAFEANTSVISAAKNMARDSLEI